MNFLVLNQKAIDFSSSFLNAEDHFAYLERKIVSSKEKIQNNLAPPLKKSIIGHFLNLWTAPLD